MIFPGLALYRRRGMSRAIALAVFWLLFGGWSLGIFIINLKNLLRWRKKVHLSNLRLWLALLPPLAVIGALAVPSFVRVPDRLPAAREKLFEVSAPVESVREYMTRVSQGRGGPRRVYRYYISLEGYEGSLYIPKEYNFDQDAFLRWAGPDKVTFRYARMEGRNTVYAIEKPDCSAFLEYDTAAEQLRVAAVDGLITAIVFVLFFAALALRLPEFLYQNGKRELARWMAVVFGGAGLFLLLVGLSRLSKPTVTETPADTSPQITVEIAEGVAVTLPRGWAAYTLDDSGTQWYKAEKKVSTAFRLTRWPEELPEEAWCRELLADHRSYLLETFIKKPRASMGPFLEGLRRSGSLAPGTDFWISEGWGTSNNNYKDHFLLVFLPREQCEIAIQSSSSGMSWRNLQSYVEEWIYPLLSGIETAERP